MTTKDSNIPRQTKNSQLMDFRNDVRDSYHALSTNSHLSTSQVLAARFRLRRVNDAPMFDSRFTYVKIEPLAPSVLTGPPGLIKAEPPRRCMLLLSFSYPTPPTPRPPTPSEPVELVASAAPSPDTAEGRIDVSAATCDSLRINPNRHLIGSFARQPAARPDGHITTCAGFAHKPGTFLAHVPGFVQCAVLAGACAGFNMYLPSGFRWSRAVTRNGLSRDYVTPL
ncbi:hypothetical protein DFH09DRAFT_1111785 [Mycena vulgaris]|nr:hypothetical protein DFH09DRAFT_1111785 [Mycena vulgaris]